MTESKPERPLSKTQLEAWRACKRRWGWPYLAGETGSNRFADLGTRVHSQLEAWLARGELPDPTKEEGRIAEAGLHLLPTSRARGNDALLVESEIFTITQQAIYHGFADIIEPSYDTGEVVYLPRVTDHKSTVDFKWALTAEQLRRDIQASIYGRAAMQQFGTDAAVARWIYYRTRSSPKTHIVETTISHEEVERTFAEVIDPIAAEIQAAHDAQPNVLDLEPNFRSCSDYGGCPHRERCNVNAKGRLLGMIAHQSLADRMKAKASTKPAEPAEEEKEKPAPADVAAGVNPPEAPRSSLKERMRALAEKNGSPTAEAPPPDKKAEPTAEDVHAAMDAMKIPRRAAPKPAEEPPAESAPTPAPEQKTRRTPKKKAEAPASEPASELPEVAPIEGGFILLYGCMPMPRADGQIQIATAQTLIDQARRLVEEELGVPDYRLADFNRGPAMLAAALRTLLDQNPIAAGTWLFLEARDDSGRHAYEALRERAAIIIKGI